MELNNKPCKLSETINLVSKKDDAIIVEIIGRVNPLKIIYWKLNITLQILFLLNGLILRIENLVTYHQLKLFFYLIFKIFFNSNELLSMSVLPSLRNTHNHLATDPQRNIDLLKSYSKHLRHTIKIYKGFHKFLCF